MATYPPPTETLPTFNSTVFTSPLTDGLTITEADTRYLRFPIGQGDETISNLDVVGTLTAGTFAPTTLSTNTIQGTAVGTAVSLYNEVTRTGEIQIGKDGTSTKTITIGNDTATTTALKGSTITSTKMAVAGALSAGASTLTSVQTNTIAGTAMTIQPITSLLIGTTSSIPITIGSSNTLALNGSAITAPLMTIAGALSAGASTLTSVITNTITGATMSIQPSVGLNLADTLTTGSINIGRQDTTSTGTTVNLAIGNGQTGTISIGTGTGTKIINIGGTNTTLGLIGSTITATKMAIAGVLSAGASTLTSVISNTYNATAIGSAMTIGNNITTGSIDIGNTTTGGIGIGTTSGSGTISIGYSQPLTLNSNNVGILTGSNCSGTVSISTGNTQSKTVNIGGINTTINLIGSTITASLMAVAGALSAGASTLTSVITNTITGTAVGTAVSLYGESSRSGVIEIGNGGSRSGEIRIGNGASTTAGVLIGRNGGGVSIGASGSINYIDGTNNIGNGTHTITGATNINTTGSLTTTIGNASASTQIGGAFGVTGATTLSSTLAVTGATTLSSTLAVTGATTLSSTVAVTGNATFNGDTTLGNASADDIIPNGTLTKPFLIGTYATTSSYSTTSLTPVTTFLGGTLESTSTASAVVTGTFVYPFISVTPYDVDGGLSLTAGTYLFSMGINWEDTSAFDITDIRMGVSNTKTLTSASTEANYVSASPNLTCYFHKTDATASAVSDSENRVLSGCFRLSTATIIYPYYCCNTSVTVDTVETNILFTKIGSA